MCVCVHLWPLDTKKSDDGCRKKWGEKYKTIVGWRAFDVLYLCVYRGPETQVLRAKYRGLETQVLRVKPSVRLSRSWNSGSESQTQCPFIEVLKPRSWEPNAATRACRHGRIVSDHHGYPLVLYNESKHNILIALVVGKVNKVPLRDRRGAYFGKVLILGPYLTHREQSCSPYKFFVTTLS